VDGAGISTPFLPNRMADLDWLSPYSWVGEAGGLAHPHGPRGCGRSHSQCRPRRNRFRRSHPKN
jgi:hypothetical protein